MRDFDVKVEILEFECRMQPNEFIDWLHIVEQVFDCLEVSEVCRVKLVAIKLRSMPLYGGKILKSNGILKEMEIL